MIDNLTEAISHAREVAKEKRNDYERACALNVPSEGFCECAAEHEQLASWLEELKARREADKSGDLISRSALLNQIDTTDWSDVRLLVEDAPTVEPRNNFDLGYAKGLEDRKDKLIKELWNCRNELCLRCGKYEKAHRGACDDCRYNFKNMGQYKRGDDK